jgi:hypothetical protein
MQYIFYIFFDVWKLFYNNNHMIQNSLSRNFSYISNKHFFLKVLFLFFILFCIFQTCNKILKYIAVNVIPASLPGVPTALLWHSIRGHFFTLLYGLLVRFLIPQTWSDILRNVCLYYTYMWIYFKMTVILAFLQRLKMKKKIKIYFLDATVVSYALRL